MLYPLIPRPLRLLRLNNLRLQLKPPCINIRLEWFNKRLTINNLMPDIQHHKKNETQIINEEVRNAEFRNKCRKPLGDRDQGSEE